MATSSAKRIGVSVEMTATPGVMPTMNHAEDAILMYENTNPVTVDTSRQSITPIRPSFTKRKDSIGRQLNTFNAVTYLQGPENLAFAGGPKPWRCGKILRACGFSETINNDPDSIVYAPISTAFESIGIDAYLDGYRHQIPDAFGTFTMEAAAGEYCKVTFELTGLYIAPTVVAIPSQTFELDKAPAFKSAACTIAGETVVLKSFRLVWGTERTERRDANAANAVKGISITDRNPTLNMVVEVDTALRNYFNDVSTTDTVPVLWQVGTDVGNRVKFNVPQAQLLANPYGEADQLRTFDLNFKVQHTTDNAEIVITMD